MFTDSLNITAIGESTFGPRKLNVKQSIPSGCAIYYLSVTVCPYQSN